MAESMIAGLLRQNLIAAERISGSHPRESRRHELEKQYGIRTFKSNAEAAEIVRDTPGSSVVITVKPQRMSRVLNDLKGSVAHEGLVMSIVAGTSIERIASEL